MCPNQSCRTLVRVGRGVCPGGGRRSLRAPWLGTAALLFLSITGLCARGEDVPPPAAEPTAAPAAGPSVDRPARPRVALILSGGGARGLAHIGVLRALEEEGIPIDGIGGASMGAVIGGLYAAGISADSLASLAARDEPFRSPAEWEALDVFQKWMLRPHTAGLYFDGFEYRLPRSLVSDFEINWLLIEHAAAADLAARGDFDRLPIPFRALALDLKSGELVRFGSGDLARAIRSSMSIAVAFPPIPYGRPARLLVDPGPVDNLPVDLAADLGCEKVIAVNCAGTARGLSIDEDPTMVARGLLRILSQNVDSLSIPGWDVWIQPEVGEASLSDFEHHAQMIEAGYQAARRAMPRIRALYPEGSLPARAARPLPEEAHCQLGALRVAWVRLGDRPSSFNWLPKRALDLAPGERFSLDALGRGLRNLYATNRYESVWPRLEPVGEDEVGITLELEERAKSHLAVGLGYDNSRKARFELALRHRDFLRIGETLHASLFLGDYIQGAEAGIRSSHLRGVPFGLDLLLHAGQERLQQDDAAPFRLTDRRVLLTTTLAAGRHNLLLTGVRYAHESGEKGVGIPDWSAHRASAFVTVMADDTDERELPSRGRRLFLRYALMLEDPWARPLGSFSGSALTSVRAGPASFTVDGLITGLDRTTSLFRTWSRLDVSRATLGRFEPALYAPAVGRTAAGIAVRPAKNLSLWVRGVLGFRGRTIEEVGSARARRALEAGALQRTPLGPILVGGAFERGRKAFAFVQIGHASGAGP